MTDALRSWLIVRSKFSGDRLNQWIAGLTSIGADVYFPVIRELRPVPLRCLTRSQRTANNRIMRLAVVPFIPQIVFIRGMNCWTVADHPGVCGFIQSGNSPARVADEVIGKLKERERMGGGAIPGSTPVEYIFAKGDRVRVIGGPLAGQQGVVAIAPDATIESIDADTRLALTLGTFRVSVAVADLERA